MKDLFDPIAAEQEKLVHHPVYSHLTDLENLRIFMKIHVFAVWDFMTLLKSLQRQITCVNLPWKPSLYSAQTVRLINQIVLGEESDLDPQGQATSHFELYLKAMKEVGADTQPIESFLHSPDLNLIPCEAREFVHHHLELAEQGHVVEVAAAFFYGREKLIPEMFTSIKNILTNHQLEAPTLLYYLQRHIELDGEEHGPMAANCLTDLMKGEADLQLKAIKAGIESLRLRELLWNNVLQALPTK